MGNDVVDIGEVVDCLGKGQVHECASGLEAKEYIK